MLLLFGVAYLVSLGGILIILSTIPFPLVALGFGFPLVDLDRPIILAASLGLTFALSVILFISMNLYPYFTIRRSVSSDIDPIGSE